MGEPVGTSGWQLSEMRIEAHQAWQDLVGQIRQRPGFGDFLRAPTAARLARQAQDGAVVFVSTSSTSSTRCDALILTAEADSPVQAVPLPGLTQGKAYDQADRLRAAHLDAADPGIDPQRRITADARSSTSWNGCGTSSQNRS
ncbi:hypothetical protein ACWDSL_50640 [Streptomyces sp. NPDC000941]